MKALTGRLLAAATAATVLGASSSAMAAEAQTAAPLYPAAPAISVQLDGKELTFSDAAPQAKDGRTFLPFRTVFEAMGAQVDYDDATNQVSATRGTTKVVMTLGSTTAAVTKDGVEAALIMDVAPYAADNRTYVPVRFAAQAFGCAVGWDQDDMTAVIVDAEKLVDSTLAQYKYTYLDKFQAYNEQFRAGIWDVDAKFDASASLGGSAPLTMEGAMVATVADYSKIEADVTMKMDMLAFMESIGKLSNHPIDLTAEDKAMLESIKSDGVSVDMRGDLTGGAVYMNMESPVLESVDIPTGSWISYDFNALGIDFGALLNASKTLDLRALFQHAMAGVDLTDKETAYDTVVTVVDEIAKFLSDSAFVKNGNDYTSAYVLGLGSSYMNLSFTLSMDNEKVVGYAMSMDAKADMGGGTPGAVSLTAGMDRKNHMSAAIKLSMPQTADMSMNITGDYVKGSKAPETEPPAGAVVIPYEQLLSGALSN